MYGNHYPNDDTFGQKYDNKNIVDGTAREAAAGNFSGQGSPEYSSYSSGGQDASANQGSGGNENYGSYKIGEIK